MLPAPLAPWRVDIIADPICPWCWIGKRNFAAAQPAIGVPLAVRWRAFQLNPDMPREGMARAAYRAAKFGSADRAASLDAQVAAAGAAAGLEFRFDRQARTPNTLAAHALIRAAGPAAEDAVMEALCQAYFTDGQDISDPAVLGVIAAAHGIVADPDTTAVAAEDAGFRAAGISGVPSFALAGHVLFAGALPADAMVDAFDRAIAVLTERGLAPAA